MKSGESPEIVEEMAKNSIESEKEIDESEAETIKEVFHVLEHEERTVGAHRAKAFLLNSESNDWEEMATGICSPEPSEVHDIFAYYLLNNHLVFVGWRSICYSIES